MLQKEDREVTSQVQQQVFNRLYEMWYSPAATTHAARPKKSQKLLPCASYSCSLTTSAAHGKQLAANQRQVTSSGDYNNSESSKDCSNVSSNDSNDSRKEQSRQVQNIIQRLAKKRPLPEEGEDEPDIIEEDSDWEVEVQEVGEE